MIKDAFKLRTLLCIGALAQALLSSFLPTLAAFTPTLCLAIYAIVLTALQTAGLAPYAPAQARVPGKSSAQLPSRRTGRFGSIPAAELFVVFHFGVRFSHPLGPLSPGGMTVMDHFTKINDSCVAKAEEWGLLGLSHWRAGAKGSHNTLMLVYYFRDIAGLNAFAHSDIHRKGWDWMLKEGPKHIGFMHEAFVVEKGSYESIYGNFPPVLMGAISMKVSDEDSGGEDRW